MPVTICAVTDLDAMTAHDKTTPDILVFGGGAEHWTSVIGECLPACNVFSSPTRKQLSGDYDNVRCLVGRNFPDPLLERLPALEWIQNLSVGIDNLIRHPLIPKHVRITNTGGLYGDAIAEYVLWAMLTLSRRFHVVMQNQQKRHWQQVFGGELAGRTVGIVGVGDIGGKVARHAQHMRMCTLGFVRDEKAADSFEHIDEAVPISRLEERVGELDVIVLSLSLSASTAGLINRSVLDAMKKSAILINVARGELIDGPAVADALATGRLAGAALDVFDKEPLSRWNPLWKTPNLLLSPHASSLTGNYKTRVADLLRENMLRFAAHRPLLNEIDRRRV